MNDISRRNFGARFAGISALLCAAALGLGLTACGNTGKKSAEAAVPHVAFLVAAAKQDVGEVRIGLPEGAKLLEATFRTAHPELPGAEDASRALGTTRDKVQDLRVAKSTFFALVAPDGRIVRNDREQDSMAGKNLFQFYPVLKDALTKGYIEGQGSMPEASGVKGRDDAQWVAAAVVKDGEATRGLYATGWSWSAYAYRLETGIRSQVLSDTPEGGKVPLLYVYVLVSKNAYGAPVAPVVNGEAILKLSPFEHLKDGNAWSAPLEIDGRSFGVAAQKVPELGPDVAIAVLRSET